MQEYNKVDVQIHQLCQIIAKINRTFVPKKEDDSHTNLTYETIGNKIYGRWINSKDERYIFLLNLNSYQFEWKNDSLKTILNYSISGNKIKELELAIEKDLPHLGLDPSGFRAELHFKIPNYPIINKPFSSLSVYGLEQWIHFRNLANSVSRKLLNFIQHEGEVRIWPHHFDTGTYVVVPGKVGIGFGLAMKDSLVDAPYFYISGYSMGKEINYDEDLPKLSNGIWISEGEWKGAVISLDDLKNLDETTQREQVKLFIKETGTWFIS